MAQSKPIDNMVFFIMGVIFGTLRSAEILKIDRFKIGEPPTWVQLTLESGKVIEITVKELT